MAPAWQEGPHSDLVMTNSAIKVTRITAGYGAVTTNCFGRTMAGSFLPAGFTVNS
jgi:hypothetical protein